MAIKSVGFLALLLFATIMLGFNLEKAYALGGPGPVCSIRPPDAYYMTCPSTGSKHLSQPCFCPASSTGCKIFRSDNGAQVCKKT